MKTPSTKTLSRVFSDAIHAKHILQLPRSKLLALTELQDFISKMHNPPDTYVMRLHALNLLDSGLHGVEYCRAHTGEYAEYLNTGETYAETLIYWRGRYRVQSLGDFIETLERNGVKFQ
jgi:hypothetical protein